MSVWKSMWGNGGRPVLVAFFGFLACFALLGAALAYPLLTHYLESDFRPLYGYTLPQAVTASAPMIDDGQGHELYQLHVGDTYTQHVEKCAHADTVITGESHWHKVDTPERIVPNTGFGSSTLKEGCVAKDFTHTLPETLTPGKWILEGEDTAVNGNETQTLGWYSGPFEVVQ